MYTTNGSDKITDFLQARFPGYTLEQREDNLIVPQEGDFLLPGQPYTQTALVLSQYYIRVKHFTQEDTLKIFWCFLNYKS